MPLSEEPQAAGHIGALPLALTNWPQLRGEAGALPRGDSGVWGAEAGPGTLTWGLLSRPPSRGLRPGGRPEIAPAAVCLPGT